MARSLDFQLLHREIIECRRCPRLVAWREQVAKEKRRAFREETYWGRPLPGFGDLAARLVIVGLAPAAHGGNRTGRFFTGDRSGDFLFAGLYRAGFCNQPTSVHPEDGLVLRDAYIVAPVRCAPPDNKPSPEEFARCRPFFERELDLLQPKILLTLGAHAWSAALGYVSRRGGRLPSPKPVFAHGATLVLEGAPALVGCYHVSQQNTQTGRLTDALFDAVMSQVQAWLKPGKVRGPRPSATP